MSLIKYDPFRGFNSLFNRMNYLMNSYDRPAVYSQSKCGYVPRVNISEDEKGLYFEAEIPGMSKEEIKVTVNDENVLMISGERKQEEKQEDKNYIRYESRAGQFCRSFMLPENVDPDSIKANYNNGLLNLEIAKKEPEKPKELTVEIN